MLLWPLLLKSDPASFQTKQDKLAQKQEKGAAAIENAASVSDAVL